MHGCFVFDRLAGDTVLRRRYREIDVDPRRRHVEVMLRLARSPRRHRLSPARRGRREGLLLSPLPFRSPEFNKKDDAGCLDGWRVGILRR